MTKLKTDNQSIFQIWTAPVCYTPEWCSNGHHSETYMPLALGGCSFWSLLVNILITHQVWAALKAALIVVNTGRNVSPDPDNTNDQSSIFWKTQGRISFFSRLFPVYYFYFCIFFSRTQYDLCVVFKEGAGMTETSSPFLSSPAATSARYLK